MKGKGKEREINYLSAVLYYLNMDASEYYSSNSQRVLNRPTLDLKNNES